MSRARLDLVARLASVLALAMAGVYLQILLGKRTKRRFGSSQRSHFGAARSKPTAPHVLER